MTNTENGKKIWKVFCMENHWPGLWKRCYQEQVVPIGYPPPYYSLHKKIRGHGWERVSAPLRRVKVGDTIVLQLPDNRIGRIGIVTGLKIKDDAWRPLIPKSRQHADGEMGRLIEVRWDMTNGPLAHDLVVKLPTEARFHAGRVRAAISEVPAGLFLAIQKAMRDFRNWVPASGHVFKQEQAISDFIAQHPHMLEDGMTPYPSKQVREKVFSDRSRSDVLLIDKNGKTVVVECKQGLPSLEAVRQLRGYLHNALKEGQVNRQQLRGILVYGGKGQLAREVTRACDKSPRIELVAYDLNVAFNYKN